MAFCANCGAQVPGSFCPNCGTPVASSASSGTAPGAGAGYVPPQPQVAATGGLDPHVASALCYTPFAIGLICSILFLVIAPYNQNKFVRFSAFQSLFLHLGLFLFWIVYSVLTTMMMAMFHLFAAAIFSPLALLLWVGTLVLFLFMMYKSFNNQKLKLPFIGDLAEKQA